jgi:hypothetical protein
MLVKPTYATLLHITTRLRPLDQREVQAIQWDDSPENIAKHAYEMGQPSWVVCAKNPLEPAYAFGLTADRPGVWSVWGFGTNRFPEVALSVTRWCYRAIVPALPKIGHRVECYCLAEKTDAHRWLERLGGVEEGTLRGYGRNGEDFKIFAWRRDHGRIEERHVIDRSRKETSGADQVRDGGGQQNLWRLHA